MSTLDNLRANTDKLQHTTAFNTDKLVRSFAGSFRYGTDTETRTATLFGSPNDQQVYKLAHGLPRPAFTELQWSLDNVAFWEGGGSYDTAATTAVTAFTDDTYVYILATPVSTGTVIYYQLLLAWIDDYDDVEATVSYVDNTPARYTQTFNSRATAPTILQSGVVEMTTDSVVLTDVVELVPHDLTYAPEVRAFIEAFAGEVWPLNYGGNSNPYLIDDNQLEGQLFTSETDIIANASMKAAMGTRRVWYVCYGRRGGYTTATYFGGVL